MESNLIDKIKLFNQEISYAKEGNFSTEEQFTRVCFKYLKQIGFATQPILSYYESPQGDFKINAYDFHGSDDTIDIYIVDLDTINYYREFSLNEINYNVNKIVKFIKETENKKIYNTISDFDSIYTLVKYLEECEIERLKINFVLLTNGIVLNGEREKLLHYNMNEYEIRVIDTVTLIENNTEDNFMAHESIDLKTDFDRTLPCIKLPDISEFYLAYLTYIPANILAQLYKKYGFKLLESNVRAYLTGRSKVNQGILKTLQEEPDMFFAYNNGLSVICSDIKLEYIEGNYQITNLSGLQIVNGGQTTASLYEMLKILENAIITGVNFKDAYVQMKINVIKNNSRKNEIIQNISRYANTQNKVAESDLSTNEEFNILIEKKFNNTWFETNEGSQIRWYYERYKGQYENERSRAEDPKKFDENNPKSRKITKTDLAKSILTWCKMPYLTAQGAEKTYNKFLDVMTSNRENFNIDDIKVRRYIAITILQKEIDSISKNLDHGSLKATVVAYTLAILSNETNQKLNLDKIWREQSLDAELRIAITALAQKVFEELQVMPKGNTHVQMWARKEKCWDRLSSLEYHIKLSNNWIVPQPIELLIFDTTEIDLVEKYNWGELFVLISDDTHISAYDKKFIRSLSTLIKKSKPLSIKQKLYRQKVIDKVKELGYNVE